MSKKSKKRFIDVMYNIIADVQKEEGLTEKQSTRIVQRVTEKLQKSYAKKRVYIHQSTQNNRENIQKLSHQGYSTSAIAQRIGLSENWVRRVINS